MAAYFFFGSTICCITRFWFHLLDQQNVRGQVKSSRSRNSFGRLNPTSPATHPSRFWLMKFSQCWTLSNFRKPRWHRCSDACYLSYWVYIYFNGRTWRHPSELRSSELVAVCVPNAANSLGQIEHRLPLVAAGTEELAHSWAQSKARQRSPHQRRQPIPLAVAPRQSGKHRLRRGWRRPRCSNSIVRMRACVDKLR